MPRKESFLTVIFCVKSLFLTATAAFDIFTTAKGNRRDNGNVNGVGGTYIYIFVYIFVYIYIYIHIYIYIYLYDNKR